MKPTLPLIATLAALPVYAETSRELGAHEHGASTLNIAIEGTTVVMELMAPGADIVGFEYIPESDEDQAAVEAALATLRDPLSLFVPPAAAGCAVVSADVELETEDDGDHDHDDHDHDDDHDHEGDAHDHDHDEHDEHDHDSDKDHDGHDHGDEHDHEEASGKAAMHSEFHAEYALECSDPAALDTLTFAYFETFENALEVDVQFVGTSGAQAYEVERDEPVLTLAD